MSSEPTEETCLSKHAAKGASQIDGNRNSRSSGDRFCSLHNGTTQRQKCCFTFTPFTIQPSQDIRCRRQTPQMSWIGPGRLTLFDLFWILFQKYGSKTLWAPLPKEGHACGSKMKDPRTYTLLLQVGTVGCGEAFVDPFPIKPLKPQRLGQAFDQDAAERKGIGLFGTKCETRIGPGSLG